MARGATGLEERENATRDMGASAVGTWSRRLVAAGKMPGGGDLATFSVRVVSLDGGERGIPGRKVMISFTSLIRGFLEERTDGGGVAYFDTVEGEAKVFVDGDHVDTHSFGDGDQVTVSI